MNRMIHPPSRPFVYPVTLETVFIRLLADPALETPVLHWWDRMQSPETAVKVTMHPIASRYGYAMYEGAVTMPRSARYFRYVFSAKTPEGATVYGNQYGEDAAFPKNGFFEYTATNEGDQIAPPAWLSQGIAYQVFPDRFARSGSLPIPAPQAAWGSVPDREHYCGGDLRGITAKIDYLAALGITVLYLTPIFKGDFNHRYATTDYFSVDPALGSTDDLQELVKAAHEKNIRVLLDGVFNHCGIHFAPFADVLEKGKGSPYCSWFYLDRLPPGIRGEDYLCVGDYPFMPKLNFSCREVRDYFLRVGVYWIKEADIDGWRLDVADEVDLTFWQEFRREIKALRPDGALLAESWRDATDMLRGDTMDSVMNYLFRDAVLDFFARKTIDGPAFDSRLQHFLSLYPTPLWHSLYQPLGSHDTKRFLSECGGDLAAWRMALAFQMTFPGLPAVYYGDEAGMEGENDPGCRGCMMWDQVESTAFYQEVKGWIALRKAHPALTRGDYQCVHRESVFAFSRTCGEESLLIAMNPTDAVQTICLDGIHTDLLSAWTGKELTLPCGKISILKRHEKEEEP